MKKSFKNALEKVLSKKSKLDLIPEFERSKIIHTDLENLVINLLKENKILKLKIEELEEKSK